MFSTKRSAIKLKTILWGLGLQLSFAFFVLRFDVGRVLFEKAGAAINTLLSYSYAGSEFVFGSLGAKNSSYGLIFAFQVLPTIIFIASLFAVLYYLGVMQVIIRGAAWVMQRVMGASGAESLNVAASIFMGQTEAPLTVRPFLPDATQSELMTIMTSGMAHVSGGIMAAYIAFGVDAKHLLTAVIMTAPGTLLMAKMLVPETEVPRTAGKVKMPEMEKDSNFLAAISRGTTDGLNLAINVAAMLIAFLALIALINGIMGGTHNWLAYHHVGWFPSSLQQIFGWAFAPVAWVIGVPWHDCTKIGNLLGIRMVLNELVAFSFLGPMKAVLDPRSFTIATFALCGFANFSSIGIQIGGIGALAPNRRDDLARLGIRAMLAGTMANLMSASIVGLFLPR
ncbi:MAG: NupC/NupG family nucleoside CNT transporter [Candidatus Acidiferrales bacterium]